MKDKQNDKQLKLPDCSSLVRRLFHKEKIRNIRKTPSVHQSHRDAPAALPTPCSSHKGPANLNFRLSESMLPKSCKQVLNNLVAENNIDLCEL